MKLCGRCGEEKALSEFGRCISTSDGLQSYCTDCVAAWHRSPSSVASSSRPRRRTSPYQRMADVLLEIERNADDPERVRELIELARSTYRLPVPA